MNVGLKYAALTHPFVALGSSAEDSATPEQLIGELRSALQAKGIQIGDGDTFQVILRHAIRIVKGEEEEATKAASAAGMTLTAAERPLLEKALAQSGGDFGEAIVAVQRDLMDGQRALGFTNVAARGRLRAKYPNLFAS